MSAPILVVQTAFLGDLLLSSVLLREIRRARPKAAIHLVCRKGFGMVMKNLGLIDEFHEIKKGDGATYATAKSALRTLRFEWIVCPHPSLRSAQFIQGLFAGQSVSFRKTWNRFLFSRTIVRPDLPDPLRQLSLLRPLVPAVNRRFADWEAISWNMTGEDGLLPRIPEDLSFDHRRTLQNDKSPSPIAPRTWVIFPGSVWATKQWPEDSYARLADLLLKQDQQILWLGGPDEVDICQRLSERMPRTRNLAGQLGLWESLVLLSRAEGVIANDSGGQHMAAIAGCPVLSIFGPTVLDFGFRAWTPLTAVSERKELFCRPCGPHGHKKCPRGTHECMTELSVESVFGQWQKLVRVVRKNA